MMIFINILIPINLCLFQLNLDGLRRWEGTFLEDNHYEEEEEAVELDEVVEDENVSEEYVSNLREAATDVIHSLEIAQWVAVIYIGEWYREEVQKVYIVDIA